MQESLETIKAEFEKPLQFEELLSNISFRFGNIPLERVDSEIEQALKQILDFFKVPDSSLARIWHC